MAAAGGSLKDIFENPIPDPLSSWTHFLPKDETETSFDMFGEICHRVKPEEDVEDGDDVCDRVNTESSSSSSSSSSSGSNYALVPSMSPISPLPSPRLEKFSSWNGESFERETLELRTLMESDRKGADEDVAKEDAKPKKYARSYSDVLSDVRSKSSAHHSTSLFPPPITSIGRFGKPRVYFKSRKEDGRFVLREIRIPTQRLLQATREDGRLRMQVVGPVEDTAGRVNNEEEEEEEDKEEGIKEEEGAEVEEERKQFKMY